MAQAGVDVKRNGKKKVEEHHSLVIERNDLIEFLVSKGYSVPAEASIFMRVPGGGDWSYCDLHVGEDSEGIHVEFSETSYE